MVCKEESKMLAVIHWKINDRTGHGKKPMPMDMARVWVKHMNNKYGAGTHWVEWYA